jgi:uncharacterized RDD family membrane protein YckC
MMDGSSKATFWMRLNAYNIDLTILILVLFPLGFLVSDNHLYFVICFLAVVLYHGVFEGVWNGATPGKKFYQLRVVNLDGSQISILKAFVRVLLKFVSASIAFFGFTMIGFHPKRQGLHDLILGTIVLDISEKSELMFPN